ncbi:MAG TPA: PAS domain-containing protein [Ferrovibrio sp.]|jgi:hypothetical protein|uniref:PAS domain-containing protein n=1 Tax=Ferrovibrio sp. TaxID=1917215 RepID=UPI002B4AFC94|nr:PAS domain-containing protein [Ferrovibrio sp.]HLT77666.1 PAS domain-containing protein [Ferrovibrio sp.]
MLGLDDATAILRSGYDYWERKRAGRPMPARRDIDPLEITALLPHVVLLDVLHDSDFGPLDFRYRVMGTAVEAKLSQRYTGLRMSEIAHQRPPGRLWSNFETVVRTGQPLVTQVPYIGPHKDFLAAQDLITPLSSDGSRVDMLFNFVDFIPRHPR